MCFKIILAFLTLIQIRNKLQYLTSKYTLKYRFPKMPIYLRPTNAALTSMFRTFRYHPNHKVSILPL